MTAVLLAAACPACAAVVSIDQVTSAQRGDLLAVADVGNVSVLLHAGLADSHALVEQTGLGQQSVVIQESGLDAGGLYAQVLQSAAAARSLIVQSGSMNQAFVYQTVGAGSVSSIVQSGTGNTAIVRQ
ncbi:MAG: hypothetical protein Q8N10_00170 [Phenylobacterium sp.]|uniref:hypothetical protein n=1 Tax=Phenylobacterium sp. TaxID=1871053 RepID=UPI0027247F13|nr:hypothetical protein [Phenylobacterium sp.]MDO8911432.1 hypothetical protein [Phenylobacterium sp.]MDP3098892.1 hypothetical protein [Phenylobacterium sp.]